MQSGTTEHLAHAFNISLDPRRVLKELDLVNTIEYGIDSV